MARLSFSLIVLLLLIGQSLLAQFTPTHRLSFGLSRNNIYLATTNDVFYFGDRMFSSGRIYNSETVVGVGVSAGYNLQFHERWEVQLGANYSGRNFAERALELSGFSNTTGDFEYALDRPRKYRALWLESLLLWRVLGPNVKPDIQLGTGFTYLYYMQDYMSGFDFDLNLGTYDVRYFTKERRHNLGIPIRLQFQYPITYRLKLGVATYTQLYFSRNNIRGWSVFGAYRLGQ